MRPEVDSVCLNPKELDIKIEVVGGFIKMDPQGVRKE